MSHARASALSCAQAFTMPCHSAGQSVTIRSDLWRLSVSSVAAGAIVLGVNELLYVGASAVERPKLLHLQAGERGGPDAGFSCGLRQPHAGVRAQAGVAPSASAIQHRRVEFKLVGGAVRVD